MNLAASQRIGSYRVVRKLGEGGMGTVYLAVHEKIERRVAIKVLRADLSQKADIARRFLDEARVVNIVHHPGLVQVSDFGQLDNGTAYIVMEYLEGESLDAYLLRKGGRLRAQDVALLATQIALALAAAHDKGIVHRDLKPDNAMLVPDPGMPRGRRIKLLDFGIAKVAAEHKIDNQQGTHVGALLGTPAYMAPEQCRGAEQVDGRADVYSLGCIVYRMLVGHPPFRNQGLAVLVQHMEETPRPLHELDPAIPVELSSLVRAMLNKLPAERPAMAQVAGVLGRLAEGGAEPAPSLSSASVARNEVERRSSMMAAPSPGLATPTTPTPQPVSGNPWPRRLLLGASFSLVGLLAVIVILMQRGNRLGHGPPGPAGPTGNLAGSAQCSESGFCKENPTAQDNRLRRLWGSSATDVWAVGDLGTLMHWDGLAWSRVPAATTNKLHGVFGFARDQLWASGDRGILLRYDGARWTPIEQVASSSGSALWGTDPSNVWLVGKEGMVLHFDGAAWRPVDSGIKDNLYGVWGSGARDIWAVGKEGTVLHFDGATWRPVDSGTREQLNSIWGSGGADAWAVGKKGVILHWNGSAWSASSSGTTADLCGLWGSGGADVWAAGTQGVLVHFDGKAWSAVHSSITTDLDAVWGLPGPGGADEVWAVGIGGVILHRHPRSTP